MFNLKDRFHERMDEVDRLLFSYRESRRRQRNPSAIVSYAADTLIDICMYLFYGYQVLVSKVITLGQFSLYINALRELKTAVDDIIYVMTDFVVNIEYLDKFFAFNEQKVDISNAKFDVDVASDAKIQFENVSFRYPNAAHDTLKNINITINSGEKLLIVGENGAGKSTFVKLLMRLYDPTEGTIFINGIDIKKYDYDQYLALFAPIFQDYKLFAFTLDENISSFDEAKPEEVLVAAEKAGIADRIQQCENGYSTYISKLFDENGVEFSGGSSRKSH